MAGIMLGYPDFSPGHRSTKEDSILNYERLGVINISTLATVFKVKRLKDNKIYALKAWNKFKCTMNVKTGLIFAERNGFNFKNYSYLAALDNFFLQPGSYRHEFFVYDFYPNGNLETICREEQGLRSDVIQFYTAELLMALAYIHKAVFGYRNIRPRHLLLDSKRHLRLCDYSETNFIGQPPMAERSKDPRDIAYMSPEVFTHAAVTRGEDLWALGAVIYFLHTNADAFPQPEDRSEERWIENIRSANFEFVTPTKPVMQDVISKFLSLHERERLGYNSFNEVKNHPFFSSIVDWENLHRRTPPEIKYPFPDMLEGQDSFPTSEDGNVYPPPPGIPSTDLGDDDCGTDSPEEIDPWSNVFYVPSKCPFCRGCGMGCQIS